MSILFVSRNSVHARYYRKIVGHLDADTKIHIMGKPSLAALAQLGRAFSHSMDDMVHSQYKRKLAKKPGFWQKSWVRDSYKVMLGVVEKLRLAKYLALLEQEKPDYLVIWNGNKLPNQTVALAAQVLNIPTYFFENGLIPGTTSLDPQGVNYVSSVPRDKAFYFSEQIEQLPAFTAPEIAARAQHVKRQSGDAVELPERYLFVPFQVPHDTQVVCFSSWISSMEQLYLEVMSAVKKLNDPGLKVVFKEHPSWHQHFTELYAKEGQGIFANHNDTVQLIQGAEAVITINSTVGLEALQLGKKVITVGEACYNLPDLVLNSRSQSELTEHLQQLNSWQPDLTLRNNFFRYLQHVYSVTGKWGECSAEHIQAVNQRLEKQDLFARYHAGR